MWKALVLSLVLSPCIFSTMTKKELRSFLEQHKPEHKKREMFSCGNGEETYQDFICDGDNDCGDCTDELADDCTLPCVEGLWNADDNTTTLHDININDTMTGPIQDAVFQCANNQSTSISYICDGDNDCGDCSDELENGCTEPCVEGLWNPDDFQCSNGESTDADYICDGDNDCGDCSDERQAGCTEPCVEGLWNPDDFACDNGESTSPAYLCDGDNDCNDCSDERQAGCDLPCVEGQWNARTLNKKRQQKKTLMKKNMKRESTMVVDTMASRIVGLDGKLAGAMLFGGWRNLNELSKLAGALLLGGWRTLNELSSMNIDDQRNTLIVELDQITKYSVPELQGKVNVGELGSLVGIAGLAIVLRDQGIKSVADLSGMDYDSIRNTLISNLSNKFGLPIHSLQSQNDAELVSTALFYFDDDMQSVEEFEEASESVESTEEVSSTAASTSLPTASPLSPTTSARRRMLKKLQYLLNKRRRV